MSETTTFGDLVKQDKFDPMSVDTSDIKELSAAIPKDGNIDINIAENLATKFLRGVDLCGEMLTVATLAIAQAKDDKQRAYNYAFLVKSTSEEWRTKIKTDKMRVSFAELDKDYEEACVRYNKCLAFHKWIDSKMSSFNKMHYLCKKILDRGYEQEKAESWQGKVDDMEYDKGW